MSELPEGWVYTELSEVLSDVLGGGTPSKTNLEYFNGNIPFMTVKDMKTHYPQDTQDKISAEALNNSSAKLIPADTLIISTRMGLGKICRAPFETAINQDLKALFVNEAVSKDFLFYWYKRNAQLIEGLGKGTTVKGIRLETLKTLELKLLPLNEQKRIASKLGQVFGEIDSVRTHLHQVPIIFNNFRQSIIRHAVTGRLTRNRGTEDSLLPSEWRTTSLEKIGELARGKSKHRPRNDARLFGGPYPFIQTGDVANSNQEITSHSQTYSEYGLQQGRLFPEGTLCITIAANIADTAVLTYPTCFPDSVVGFIADTDKVETYFIKYFIDSLKTDLELYAPATAQKNINLRILRELTVPLPSLEEQKEIVNKARNLFLLIDQIEEKYNLAMKSVDEITQSVLAKACNGELAPQDPNDEPASILLERTKVENTLQELIPKQRRRKNSKKNQKVKKMISSVLDTLKREQKPLTAQILFQKSGYPLDSDPEVIEKFFLNIKTSLSEGTIIRERINNEDIFKIAV